MNDDFIKGAGRSAQIVRNGVRRRHRAVANPLRVPVPDFLEPVERCGNDFDRGLLFGVLALHRELFTIGALGAFEVGASAEAAEEAGRRAGRYFVQQASELMHDNQIGPFQSGPHAPVWTAAPLPKIDWRRLAAEPGANRNRAKWGAVEAQT